MKRRPELDSLRGLAALAVLAYHTMALNSSTLTNGIALLPVDGVLANILVYSPVHLFWLGAESVWLFFVLSGFVLTKSATRDGFSLEGYYPGRMVRLYVPVAASVVLAWLIFLVPHLPSPGINPDWATTYPPASILSDLILVGGASTSTGVLWSLQWEVIFSLLLPVYVIIARRFPLIGGAMAAGVLVAGWYLNVPAASFLPMFFFGTLLAVYWDRLSRWGDFFTTARGHAVAAAMMVLAVCGLTSAYLLGPMLQNLGLPMRAITVPITMVAIVIVVALVQLWAPLRRVLQTRPLVFVGTVSFSIYLVHFPIVVLLRFLLPAGPATAVFAVLVALAIAVGFYYLVERPAHNLSRRVSASARAARAESVEQA